MNMNFHDETVATDTIYSETPDIGNGSICAQLFIGAKSLAS